MLDFDTNQPCYIVAGGPSLSTFDWSKLDNKFVIAINRAYEVLPNANIVYFCDNEWWSKNKDQLLKHKAIKIKGSLPTSKINDANVIEYVFDYVPYGYSTKPMTLCHGYNSGCAVINLAIAHLGFKEVYLLGYDMKWQGQQSHWHNGYGKGRNTKDVYKTHMIESFKYLIPMLKPFGANVYNVTNDSELNVFPKVPFDQVFG